MVRTWPCFWLWVRINPGEVLWVPSFHWFCSFFFSSLDSLSPSFPLATADSNIDPIFSLRCPRVTSGRSGQLLCRSRNLQPTGARNALWRLSLQGWDMKHCIGVAPWVSLQLDGNFFLPGDFTETSPVSPIVTLRSNIGGLILTCIATCASVYQAHQLHLYATGLDAQGHVTSSPQVKMGLYVLDSKQT